MATKTELKYRARTIWDILCELRPRLRRFPTPKIELSNRFWSTAGTCDQEERIITLANKFLQHPQNRVKMLQVILPHELIHQADFDLYGFSEKNCGHGKRWAQLMIDYGLDPEPHHTMRVNRK
jgi:predicted SprT family Zn-dependent metalloprotease